MEYKRELRQCAQAQSFGGEKVLFSPFLSVGSLDFPDVPTFYLPVDYQGLYLSIRELSTGQNCIFWADQEFCLSQHISVFIGLGSEKSRCSGT